MNMTEVGQLLTVAGLADGRQITREMVAWWHELIGDLDFADAKRALADHQRESDRRVMPANIRERALAYRRALEPAQTMSPAVPEDCGRHRMLPNGTCMHCTYREEA